MSTLSVPLVKNAQLPLTEQLADRFIARIKAHLLAPGSRLPSVRQCAQQLQVSPATVVAAYERLVAQGYIEAQRNRGFYVRSASTYNTRRLDDASPLNRPGDPTPEGVRPRLAPVNAGALIRGMFHPMNDKPQPGLGVLPANWLDNPFLAATLRQTVGKNKGGFHDAYGEPQGDSALRETLATQLGHLHIACRPQQILTTIGATQALDIISRTLLRPGDAVMVEEPGWAIEFARLNALGMRILPVPRDQNGPNLSIMQAYCERDSPKLYVSVSVLHNPTGFSLNPGSAHALLQLAQRYGFYVVEDDTYSYLADEHATRLCALDGLERTLYVSGFSKVLAPNWRVGYLAAPAPLVEPLLETKLLTTLTTPALLERTIAETINQGHLRRHAQRLRQQLAQSRTRSAQLALQHGCHFAAEPAGLFGWVDTGVDTETLAQHLLDSGYLLAPGALFHANRAVSHLMRINFTTTQQAAFWQAFGVAVKRMKE